MQAALAGQGLVADAVRRGELVAFRPEVRLAGAFYSVVCVPGRERHGAVRVFEGWLSAQPSRIEGSVTGL